MNPIVKELNYEDDYYQYCCLLKQLTTIDPEKISRESFLNHLYTIKSNPYHKIIIAKCDNKIVGTATVLIEPKIIHNLSKVAHIEDVVVDTEYRSKGIGKTLIKKVIDISREFGCYKVILDCSSKNIEFYEKMGFKKKECQMALYLDV
jgi:glucosamine-phosphate N-acetyltransferase